MGNRAGAQRNHAKEREFDGGRSRTWTYDLAHVRRADIKSNLIELLTEILLEASAGDNQEP